MAYCCHLIEVTLNFLWDQGEELLVTRLLQKSQRVEQSSSFRSKKTAIGWFFKQLLGHAALGPTKRKVGILPPRPSIQVHTQGVSPQNPRIFQTDLGSRDLSYRENMMELMFGYWFAFPCECGFLHIVSDQGRLPLKKDLQTRAS